MHIEFLYSLATAQETAFRWRSGGQVPPMEVFAAGLWDGMLAQFVVRDTATHRPAGHVQAYHPDLHSGHAYIAAIGTTDSHNSGLMPEAMFLFVNYCFTVFNLRKLYLEAAEFNEPQYGSALGRFFKEEGRLRDHSYYDGRFWDRGIYSIYREDFAALRQEFGRFVGLDTSASIEN
jgi:RimJ/RimL family protein N-acetyltransferase